MEPSAPGWYPDPYGRHERRYWSGIRWSRHVDDGGRRTEDPLDTGPVTTAPPGERSRERPQERTPQLVRPPDRFGEPAHAADPFGEPGRTSTRLGEPSRLPVRVGDPDWPGHEPRGARPPRGPQGRRPIVLVAASLVAVLIAGAAFMLLTQDGGGSNDGTEDDPLRSRLVEVMHEKSGGTIDDEEALCMANALLDTTGRQRLIDLGVLDGADPILATEPEEKRVAIPAAFDCLEDDEMIEFMVATWPEGEGGLTPAVAPCVFQRWFEGLGRERFTYMYSTFAQLDPPPLDQTLNENEFKVVTRVLVDCQEELAATSAPATTAPPP